MVIYDIMTLVIEMKRFFKTSLLLFLILVMAGGMIMIFGSCGKEKYSVDYSGQKDCYKGAKDSYRAGQNVILYYDNTISFYLFFSVFVIK